MKYLVQVDGLDLVLLVSLTRFELNSWFRTLYEEVKNESIRRKPDSVELASSGRRDFRNLWSGLLRVQQLVDVEPLTGAQVQTALQEVLGRLRQAT